MYLDPKTSQKHSKLVWVSIQVWVWGYDRRIQGNRHDDSHGHILQGFVCMKELFLFFLLQSLFLYFCVLAS